MWNIRKEVCFISMVLAFSALLDPTPSSVSASLVPVPGASTIYQNVLYNLQTTDGSFLDMTPFPFDSPIKDLFPRPVFFRFRQDLASNTSANFLFIPRGGIHPGLAGMTITATGEVYHFLGRDETSSPETMQGNAGTVFSPALFCYGEQELDFYFSSCKKYSRFSLKQVELGKESLYLLAFSDDDHLEKRSFIGKQPHPDDASNDGDEKRFIPSITENEDEAIRFKILPALDHISYSIVRFNSESDITDNAKDIKMASDEVILNKANVVVDHIYSKKLTVTSIAKFKETWRLKIESKVKIEKKASIGLAEFISFKAKTSVEARVSFEGGMTSETVVTNEEDFEVSETVTIQPFKAVRCQSWVKVVQGSKMPYRAESIVRMFFKGLDPVSGELVEQAMPPQLVLSLIPYYVQGWTILKQTETGVLVEMRGEMTARFGISAFFSSENIDDPGLLARYDHKKPEGMFASIDRKINPKMDL